MHLCVRVCFGERELERELEREREREKSCWGRRGDGWGQNRTRNETFLSRLPHIHVSSKIAIWTLKPLHFEFTAIRSLALFETCFLLSPLVKFHWNDGRRGSSTEIKKLPLPLLVTCVKIIHHRGYYITTTRFNESSPSLQFRQQNCKSNDFISWQNNGYSSLYIVAYFNHTVVIYSRISLINLDVHMYYRESLSRCRWAC